MQTNVLSQRLTRLLGFALGSWNFISFSLNPLDDTVAGMLILYVPMFASWGVAGFLDARLNWRASGPARSTPETQPGEALVSASAQGFDRSLLTGWNFGSTTEPHAAHPLPRRILLEASDVAGSRYGPSTPYWSMNEEYGASGHQRRLELGIVPDRSLSAHLATPAASPNRSETRKTLRWRLSSSFPDVK